MEYFLGGVAAVLGGGRLSSAIGAYLVGTQYSARGACASDQMRLEIRSNFAVQSPPN
jgi:hypothetical protein